MKKTLILAKNESIYELKLEKETLISIVDKKITGESIFEKIYKDVPPNTKIEIVIVHVLPMEDGKIIDKEDKLIFDQIKELFKKIDKAIGDTVLKQEKVV